MSPVERSGRLGGIRVEISVQTERVRDGQHLCDYLDLFRFGGVEVALGGGFLTCIIPIEEFMDMCYLEVSNFTAVLHGTNERVPNIRLQSTLTIARQSIRWSGKFMRQQLRMARACRDAERRQIVTRME